MFEARLRNMHGDTGNTAIRSRQTVRVASEHTQPQKQAQAVRHSPGLVFEARLRNERRTQAKQPSETDAQSAS